MIEVVMDEPTIYRGLYHGYFMIFLLESTNSRIKKKHHIECMETMKIAQSTVKNHLNTGFKLKSNFISQVVNRRVYWTEDTFIIIKFSIYRQLIWKPTTQQQVNCLESIWILTIITTCDLLSILDLLYVHFDCDISFFPPLSLSLCQSLSLPSHSKGRCMTKN